MTRYPFLDVLGFGVFAACRPAPRSIPWLATQIYTLFYHIGPPALPDRFTAEICSAVRGGASQTHSIQFSEFLYQGVIRFVYISPNNGIPHSLRT